MELRDCYAEFGGDYKEVLGRLQREQTVQKFVLKFLDDKSFSSLETALQNRNYEEALQLCPYAQRDLPEPFFHQTVRKQQPNDRSV